MSYSSVAKLINESMSQGRGFIESVRSLAEQEGLDPKDFTLNPTKIANEICKLLQEDYSQTLMISAVLGQLVTSKEQERFPAPAFFLFLEFLSDIEETPKRLGSELPANVDDATTQVIELTTTLVSIICEWTESGIMGVSKECPPSLFDIARSVYRKTKLLQSGMWTCLSCGKIVNVSDTHALLCDDCDSGISGDEPEVCLNDTTYDRTGYGRIK
jgi:hypothetical protein